MLFRNLTVLQRIVFGGFLCPRRELLKIRWKLCLGKAFFPLAINSELIGNRITIITYIRYLRRKYNARNSRHLMYILYQRNSKKHDSLKSSKRGIDILGYLSKGATYREIAQRLNISVRGVENHLDRMRNNNRLQTVDELVVLYADWEHGQRENK